MGKLMRLLDAGRQRASTLQAEVNAPSGGGAGRYTASPGVAELTSWEQAEMAARDKTSCNVDPAGAASDTQLQAQLRGIIEALRAEGPAMGPQCDLVLKVWKEVGSEGSNSAALRRTGNATRARTVPPPQPIKPTARHPSWLDYDPLEIARQMTLMDWDVYCQLQPHELLGNVRGDSVVAKSVGFPICISTIAHTHR